ncbi:hypothetical protein SDC9_76315 [bioreactor metagenome]|uniref:Uncharacterized protein n=1 Tax=bioreactor metagenome TaxID=1076179 RepID=A0A644YUS9_9ZZZZ
MRDVHSVVTPETCVRCDGGVQNLNAGGLTGVEIRAAGNNRAVKSDARSLSVKAASVGDMKSANRSVGINVASSVGMNVSAVCRTARTHIQLTLKIEFRILCHPAAGNLYIPVAVDNGAGNRAAVLNENTSAVIDGGADGNASRGYLHPADVAGNKIPPLHGHAALIARTVPQKREHAARSVNRPVRVNDRRPCRHLIILIRYQHGYAS